MAFLKRNPKPVVDMRIFMPGAQYWLCRFCNEEFWWHPGASGRARPSECACGKITDQFLLIRLEEPVGGKDD